MKTTFFFIKKTYVAICAGEVQVPKSALGINFLFIGVSIVTLQKKKIRK